MARSLPRRLGRLPRGLLRHEPLETRICLSADTSAASSVLLDWNGRHVEARRDAWIVRSATATTAADLRIDTAWRATTLGEGFYSLVAPGAGTQDVLGWAARAPGVAYVEPDFTIAPRLVSNDPSLAQLWGLNNTGQSGGVADADIDAPEAWNVTTGSRSVVVAVIDTGVDYTHADLAANAWRNPGEVAGDGIDNDRNGFVDDVYGWDFANNDANPMDDNGHGTHVSGTIGAVGNNGRGMVGVNWQVSIMGLKFLDASGSGATSDAIAAVNYATKMRRDFGINVVASNNSWGGGGSSTALRDAIEAGGRSGILFVAAAGNEAANNDRTPSFPANYTSDVVISVAATDRSNRLASFSNYGATSVDLGAPGASIYSTVPGNAYATYSGTSMATPHVTGAVALLAAARAGSTPAEIRAAILGTTTPVAALAGKTVTGGLLNVDAAVRRLTSTTTPPPEPPPEPPAPPPPPPVSGPFEANDSISTATTVVLVGGSASFTAAIGDGPNAAADVDLFAIQLAAGARITIDVDARSRSVPSTLDSYLRVFDASGRQLAANDDAGGSLDSLLSFAPTAAGTYYVGVSSYGNSAYDPRASGSAGVGRTTGDYTVAFSIAAALPADVGDTTATARTVTLGTGDVRISGRIGDGRFGGRDVDLYAVALAAGQTLVIDVDARSLAGGSTLDSYLRLFNSARRQVAANDDSSGSVDSYLSFTARTAGTYFIGVSGYGNTAYNPALGGSGRSGSTGIYELVLRAGSTTAGRGAGGMRVMGFRDEPAAVQQATFAALATAVQSAAGTSSRKR
jgi:subtilisin family serine protease